jgi:AhpD family alkylhydroperoxidase
MQPRMTHPAVVVPGAMDALQAVGATVGQALDENGVLSPLTIELVNLRVSQINGCSTCLEGHAISAKKLGETEERLHVVAGWRDAPYFTDAERAAFALAEAMTRLGDRPDPVPDDIWADVVASYGETERAALVLAIANINLWNRLNIATRQLAGAWAP